MKLRKAGRMLGVALLATAAGAAFGQADYPSRPVRIIVPSSPGGGTDILTRLITPRLTERLGQTVVVDNRPGAGSIIGNDVVAKSTPDGYTLLMGISTLAILPSMHKKLPYDAMRDLAPVTQAISAPNILVVHPSLPVKTVKELIAFAQKRPGELNYASAGPGTNPHLSMELFLSMTKIKMVHIPYRGLGPAMVDLIAGQVVAATSTMLAGLPHIRSGRLRALGLTGTKRNNALPGLPTVAEAGVPGYEAVQWYGLFAPAKTPREIIGKLHGAMTGVLHSPAVKEKFAADGAEPVGNTPEEFARFMRSETDKWAKVVRAAGLEPR
ncbi:MAG: tripartite tricarboxylate transporter substrate binding protein [Betaproteobacteria bacterium]|nr:tripartite tricarboxylate transporter substrate binding protein [Betaproteobacteria bacterium]